MKHKNTNYKSKYGFTLKEAKAMIKAKNGRLPRPGYEALIKCTVIDGHQAKFWLQNSAGNFSIYCWIGINPLPINCR